MSINRLTRVNELLRRGIAEHLIRDFAETAFDVSAVTVTRVETTVDLRHSKVFVSILGHEDDRHDMIKRLNAHHIDFQKELSREIRLKYTPRIRFVLDESLGLADHVLHVIDELEHDPSMHLGPDEEPQEEARS